MGINRKWKQCRQKILLLCGLLVPSIIVSGRYHTRPAALRVVAWYCSVARICSDSEFGWGVGYDIVINFVYDFVLVIFFCYFYYVMNTSTQRTVLHGQLRSASSLNTIEGFLLGVR
jgi:hypothetical protein